MTLYFPPEAGTEKPQDKPKWKMKLYGETAGQTEMEDEALSGIQQKGLATTGTCRIVAKPFYTENSIYSSLSKKRFKS